ncbi:hypothetical protein [Streptomyces flavofungini]|uniref:ASCH domain-containing protein n=1 Tax=Streptomyces flavofungini TaxID=68200 RepID=A0ABS0XGI2_9ACTN|nr:hypothetical protein [Streptomyces flavofungini]MBJ3812303.1 hypothetical protein [Streptomyces flavofungini]GHC88582.1 hypothetical protein GCM10010349_75960 [Streptomyces flavofungini]
MDGHFTAWLTTGPLFLDGEFCDLTVLRDERVDDGAGSTVWVSTDRQVFHALTGTRHADNDTSGAQAEAEALLRASGWRTVGCWDVVESGGCVAVEFATWLWAVGPDSRS